MGTTSKFENEMRRMRRLKDLLRVELGIKQETEAL